MSDRFSSTLTAQFVRERSILRNVYLWMTGGLALTGIVSRLVSTNVGLTRALYSNPLLLFVLIGVELLMVIVLSSQIMRLSAAAATALFIGYAALNGVTLSFIFMVYTETSITTVFFITSATFGGMSLYALTTKRDLSTIGHYAIMGLWGVLIATLVNLFIRSEALYYLISYVGVAVFLGLTAYDTQIIKRWNAEMSDSVSEPMYVKISIIGALKLYLDFINLFLFFLRIFGRRR